MILGSVLNAGSWDMTSSISYWLRVPVCLPLALEYIQSSLEEKWAALSVIEAAPIFCKLPSPKASSQEGETNRRKEARRKAGALGQAIYPPA